MTEQFVPRETPDAYTSGERLRVIGVRTLEERKGLLVQGVENVKRAIDVQFNSALARALERKEEIIGRGLERLEHSNTSTSHLSFSLYDFIRSPEVDSLQHMHGVGGRTVFSGKSISVYPVDEQPAMFILRVNEEGDEEGEDYENRIAQELGAERGLSRRIVLVDLESEGDRFKVDLNQVLHVIKSVKGIGKIPITGEDLVAHFMHVKKKEDLDGYYPQLFVLTAIDGIQVAIGIRAGYRFVRNSQLEASQSLFSTARKKTDGQYLDRWTVRGTVLECPIPVEEATVETDDESRIETIRHRPGVNIHITPAKEHQQIPESTFDPAVIATANKITDQLVAAFRPQ